jgi:hypothetical protein
MRLCVGHKPVHCGTVVLRRESRVSKDVHRVNLLRAPFFALGFVVVLLSAAGMERSGFAFRRTRSRGIWEGKAKAASGMV